MSKFNIKDFTKLSASVQLPKHLQNGEKIRIGVNGFGRFGLHLLRDYLSRSSKLGFEIKWINEPFRSATDIQSELALDPVLGETARVQVTDGNLVLPDGQVIQYTQIKDPEQINWEQELDWIFECSGQFTEKKSAQKHLRGNIKKVFISATSLTADKMVVLGVNEHEYNPEADHVISYGSCTINGFMPIAKYLDTKFGILESGLNVTHNTPLKDITGTYGTILRRTCTLEYVAPQLLPTLLDRFYVNYHLVPYPGVSLMDFSFRLRSNVSADEVRESLELASMGPLDLHVGFTPDFSQPEQHVCKPVSAMLVKSSFKKSGQTIIFSAWFDNENSAVRLNDLANFAIASGATLQPQKVFATLGEAAYV